MPLPFPHNLSQRIIHAWQQQVSPKLSSLLSVVWISGLVVAALALWGFAAIAEEVLEQETQVLDTTILQILRTLHTPLLDQIMIGITFLGEPLTLAVLSSCLGIFLLMRRKWAQGIALAIASAGAIGLNFMLKDVFARSRPALWDRIVDVKNYSFPSGHAMISLVIYGFIGYYLALRFPRVQGLITTITVLLIAAIGLSRLYLGVHWPTDVVAGYAVGLVWLFACILSLEVAGAFSGRDEG